MLTAGVVISSQLVRADSDNAKDNTNDSKIKTGFPIAPIPLNLKGKNGEFVGLGSYIVNAAGDCSGCHTQSAQDEYSFGGIPYFGQHPAVVNQKVYLGGGNSFGNFGAVEIVSRNLTPDKTGKPEGGNSFEDFVKIMRTGTDLDGWHPTYSTTSGTHCIPLPFDGSLLQVMPWPTYQNMTDHDLRAIQRWGWCASCRQPRSPLRITLGP